jgi:lipoprotein NlpD
MLTRKNRSIDRLLCAAAAATVWLLAGCASSTHPAPVEERARGARPAVPAVAPPGAVPAPVTGSGSLDTEALPPGDNSGKPGYYTVKPGDTLLRVALENGLHWKDLVQWNGLQDPNVIEVGQVLRVVAPGADPNAVGTRGVASARIETRPLGAPAVPPGGAASAPPAAAPASGPATAAAAPPTPPAATAAPARDREDDINWMWPASGPVASTFDDSRSKGLAITGKAGDPVYAAADGRVVYAGSGLRGYGNLVILKHNNTYLTAYAHNQALLVREDQSVRRGQKIAEMGSTDAERVQLHFEIRKQGKPVDPAKLLPPR